ncbi:hypothetical protein CKQ54_22465 [Rahnella variigena]|uniref:Uncharacterized protein n=1 Tax=Rahnella variigena TaxID=574964 RepID=A0ABX9PMQ6_9GAMM|nr:hypothetical protein D6D38_10610 [Rahnella variigena]RKF66173.1 hypothetical protein CKQ54_22465 [Rahnella variigena]
MMLMVLYKSMLKHGELCKFWFFARIGAKGAILKSISRSRSRPWASAHTDQRPGNARASGLRAFLLRAVAGTTDMFWCNSEWRKMSSLRDPRISGFEPKVSNRSFGAIFDHANQPF